MARELDIQLSTKGKSLIAGYTDDETAILPLSAYVLFGDHTRIVKYVDYEFAQGADGLKILGQSLNLWDLGFSTYLFLLESMIFRKKYSSSG